MKKLLGSLIILMVISSSLTVFAAEKGNNESYDYSNPVFKSIVNMLYMDGHSNDSLADCPVKQKYYNDVAKMYFKKGMSKKEILDYYRKELGEQALNAPSAKGFNLSLWITPFLLILIVFGILYFVVKKWKSNQTISPKEEEPDTKDLEHDLYLPIIEQERQKFI